MKYLYIILAALLLPSFGHAQSNYRNGYIIKNNGDTVQGYINVQEWASNPRLVAFKSILADKQPAKYSPVDIKGFGASPNFTYVSYMGVVSNNNNRYPKLDTGLDTTKRTDTVFLKQLVTGQNASLYQMSDPDKNRFFYSEGTSPITELHYYQYYDAANPGVIKTTTPFAYTLFTLSKKYPGKASTDISTLQKTGFNERDLAKFFSLINNSETSTPSAGASIRFFAGTGVNISKTWFEGDSRFTRGGKVTTVAPALSLGLDLFTNPVTQRLIFRGLINISYINPKVEADPVSFQGIDYRRYYDLQQLTIGVAPQALYNAYSAENLKFFIGAGISFNKSFYLVNRIVTDNPNKSVNWTPYNFPDFWVNIPLTAGAAINKRFEISASYALPSAIGSFSAFSTKTSALGVSVKYLFQ